MSRVFFCMERPYPKVVAASNRTEYNAKALLLCGFEPIIIGTRDNRERDFDKKSRKYIYNGMEYLNVGLNENSIKTRFKIGNSACEVLKQYNLSSKDYVIIYASNEDYVRKVKRYAHDIIGANVSFDVVEWYQSFQFKFGIFNPSYWLYNHCFKKHYASTGKVIAISEHIEQYFKNKGCKTICLPVLTNPKDYKFVQREIIEGKIRFVYPGNPYKKDSLIDMVRGINLLDENEKKRIEFHLTGISKNAVREILGKSAYLLEKLKNIIFIHSWMEYEDLLLLLEKMNFLLLAREENIVTISNFPSKIPELMACGIIPVANKVGDFHKYLLDGENAVLYEGCTPLDVKNVIGRCLLLTEPEMKRLSKCARVCSEEVFSYDKWSEKFAEFIKSSIKK